MTCSPAKCSGFKSKYFRHVLVLLDKDGMANASVRDLEGVLRSERLHPLAGPAPSGDKRQKCPYSIQQGLYLETSIANQFLNATSHCRGANGLVSPGHLERAGSWSQLSMYLTQRDADSN